VTVTVSLVCCTAKIGIGIAKEQIKAATMQITTHLAKTLLSILSLSFSLILIFISPPLFY